MGDPNLSEMTSATFEDVTKVVYDNFTNNNPLLGELKKKGNITEDYTGGEYIRQTLAYAENSTYTHYRGAERLNISEVSILSAAKFDIKQVALSVTMNGLEEVMNAGEAKLIDLFQTKSMVLKGTFENNFETDLFSAGTASGGKQIGGLQSLVADTPTSGTVGGINAATYSWWRNVSYDASSDGGAATSAANIKTYLDNVMLQTRRGQDIPDFLIADNNYYGFYEAYLSGLQQIVDSGSGKSQGSGSDELTYKGRRFVLGGGRNGSVPTDHVYFLNTDYIKLKEAKDRKLKMREAVKAIDQDAEVSLALWAGNLVLPNRFVHAVLKA
jgi:hypothetical protein